MLRTNDNQWLHRFAILCAAATLLLICIGGLVTSKEVGMSVPDWPTTFGYNMFFFPFSKWVGGIFYEHTHRLVASAVGLLTVILAVWLWLKESRAWLRWLGLAAVIAVMAQGILGGLRVTKMKDELGIFHAALAQLFFVQITAIALFTSRWWVRASKVPLSSANVAAPAPGDVPSSYNSNHSLYWIGTALIFFQLILGATMRHQHAGLAIPDFPLAYHRIWPATDPAAVELYNQQRMEVTAVKPITAFQIGLQMAHRITALVISGVVLWACWLANVRLEGSKDPLRNLSRLWAGLILSQIGLGAATIWSGKSADIATAHVAVGALSLVTGALLILVSYRCVVSLNYSLAKQARLDQDFRQPLGARTLVRFNALLKLGTNPKPRMMKRTGAGAPLPRA